MRTIAALTMIMAVVVAAIPVENLGTVQADYTNNLYGDLQSNYSNVTKPTFTINYLTGTTKKIQRISNGYITEPLEVIVNGKNAMIADYVGDSTDGFTLYDKEYRGYVLMSSGYRNAVKAAIQNEEYTVKFGEGASETLFYSDGTNTDNVSIVSVDKAKMTYEANKLANAVSGTYDHEYTVIDTGNGSSIAESIYSIYLNDLSSEIDQIVNNYNNAAANLKNQLTTAINDKNYSQWQNLKNQIASDGHLKSTSWSLTKTGNQLSAINEGKIINHTIINRIKDNKGNDLKDFNLETVQDGANNTYEIPRKAMNTSVEDGIEVQSGSTQVFDRDGYLATEELSIKGIGKGAFATSGTYSHNSISGTISIPGSVEFIGEDAFRELPVSGVSLDDSSCRIIGDNAFRDCTNLASISFAAQHSKLEEIGNQAFSHTNLSALTIPDTVTKIGFGAFEDNNGLGSIIFNNNNSSSLDIGSFAFYNCPALNSENGVNWNGRTQVTIGEGAFALGETHKNNDAPLIFVFPSGTKIDNDYILAGRTNMTSVTMPDNLSGMIPDNTLAGCTWLQKLLFPDNAGSAQFKPEQLFKGIENNGFYVEGPMYKGGNKETADTRKNTWNAKNANDRAVPYKYYDKDNNNLECWEYGVMQKDPLDSNKTIAPFIASVSLENGRDNAVLEHFIVNPDQKPSEKMKLTIGTIGDGDDRIAIKQVGNGQSSIIVGDMKDWIYEVDIEDGVQTISDNAISGAKELEWVRIAGSVTNIGSKAFANCEKLENVEFDHDAFVYERPSDAAEWSAMKIAPDAFQTNSDYLTFHGAVNSNYAPFQLAMKKGIYANNGDMTSANSRREICYKADAPYEEKLVIIRDAAKEPSKNAGKATLIDYPHYEELDTTLRDNFETLHGINKPQADVSVDETIVEQTINLVIPDGVESIDTVSYFNSTKENEKNFDYLNRIYTKDTKDMNANVIYQPGNRTRTINGSVQNASDVQRLYSDETYFKQNDDIVYPGLFSGNFAETGLNLLVGGQKYQGHTYTTEADGKLEGNDILTHITMPSVQELPDRAFYSNDNLLTFNTGSALKNFGSLPFKYCKNMVSVSPTETEYYRYNNLMIFEKTGNGDKLLECFEGRGKGGEYLTTVVSASELSGVTEIADGAFSDCTRIDMVDLSGSRIMVLPKDCFDQCTNLREVKLPTTIREIMPGSFTNIGSTIYITVPNTDCYINARAFDGKTNVIFYGTKYSNETLGDPEGLSSTYLAFRELEDHFKEEHNDTEGMFQFWDEGNTYKIDFVDDDETILKSINVKSGEAVKDEDVPTPPRKNGYKFAGWICPVGDIVYQDADTYQKNIKESRRIRARYVADPSQVVGDGEYTLTIKNGKALVVEDYVEDPAESKKGTLITTSEKIMGGTQLTLIPTDETNFKVWTVTPNTYMSLLSGAETQYASFTMPNADVTVEANAAIGGGTDTPDPDGTYTVTVNNGTGSGNYRPGVTVTITANTPPTGQTFVNWTTTTAGVTLANASSNSTTFVMPSANVSVTANFSGGNQGGNNPGDGTNKPGDNGNNDNNKKKYKVTVNYGSGSGEYEAGATVNITANAPESSSRVFSRWTTNNSGLGFSNANAVSTSFVMPAADVTVTANYKTRTDDDDDDDAPSRRPGTNTNTSTVPNRPGSSTSTTGTNGTVSNPANTTTSNNGNRIYITKNGISNTDVASLAVSGSTDNFIVRITESPEATAAVEQSLTNTYGSLNGLAYLPMDISLYDSTGQNKITDSTGLNITVTMPIPDVLIQYGGNARVAAADNGNLQQITPRFTTIDGIACVSFVPPHFSPYVIYVDTNNLIAGQMLDSTPATGDPIHPKWFAAIGMACVSILLFVLSDGRKRRKYRAA